MENTANVLRIALIVSIVGHVVFFALSAHDLRPTTHGESMDVQLVPANEAPGGPQERAGESANAQTKPQGLETQGSETKAGTREAMTESKAEQAKAPDSQPAPKAEPKVANAKTPAAKSQTSAAQPRAEQKSSAVQPQPAVEQKPAAPQPQPQTSPEQKLPAMQPQPQQPSSAQAAEQHAPIDSAPASSPATTEDINRVASMLGLPFGVDETSGTQAERMSKFTEGVKEFKTQVRRCLKLPSGITPDQRIKMVIRVALTRNGTLAREPEVLDAANPTVGFPLLQSVRLALTQCAPYRLPADKYDDWKVLDIDFSPDQMMGS
jgi:outer membrane biosynthesis protein TonB